MRFLIALLVLFAPMPALALSCVAPSIERSFARYAAAEESYVVVHGRLTLDQSLMPKGMSEVQPPRMTHVPAKLSGSFLSKAGFVSPFEQPLTLEVACLGPWCGNVQSGAELLAFVRKDAGGYAMRVTPCGGAAFTAPDPEMLKQVAQCMAGGECRSD